MKGLFKHHCNHHLDHPDRKHPADRLWGKAPPASPLLSHQSESRHLVSFTISVFIASTFSPTSTSFSSPSSTWRPHHPHNQCSNLPPTRFGSKTVAPSGEDRRRWKRQDLVSTTISWEDSGFKFFQDHPQDSNNSRPGLGLESWPGLAPLSTLSHALPGFLSHPQVRKIMMVI